MEHCINHNYISIEAHNFYNHGTLPEQYTQYSDNYNPHVTFNMSHLYKTKVLDIMNDGAYMGTWQIFQAANNAKRLFALSIHVWEILMEERLEQNGILYR